MMHKPSNYAPFEGFCTFLVLPQAASKLIAICFLSVSTQYIGNRLLPAACETLQKMSTATAVIKAAEAIIICFLVIVIIFIKNPPISIYEVGGCTYSKLIYNIVYPNAFFYKVVAKAGFNKR